MFERRDVIFELIFIFNEMFSMFLEIALILSGRLVKPQSGRFTYGVYSLGNCEEVITLTKRKQTHESLSRTFNILNRRGYNPRKVENSNTRSGIAHFAHFYIINLAHGQNI